MVILMGFKSYKTAYSNIVLNISQMSTEIYVHAFNTDSYSFTLHMAWACGCGYSETISVTCSFILQNMFIKRKSPGFLFQYLCEVRSSSYSNISYIVI